MIIHSYLTNGSPMFKFAMLFLKSFKYYHGDNTKIIFSSRDLSDIQIENLKKSYKNLEILNESFDYNYISKESGLNIDEIKRIKLDVENGINISGKKNHILMKQYISVEDRYRKSILDVINIYKPDNILHLDIDICFKNKIDPMVNILKENDVSFKIRNSSNRGRSIVGYALGFNINKNSILFIDKWMEYIDQFDLKNKPKGWGQTSLWKAYLDLNNYINIGYFPAWTTGNMKNYKNNSVILLSGNKRTKPQNIKLFEKIYKE